MLRGAQCQAVESLVPTNRTGRAGSRPQVQKGYPQPHRTGLAGYLCLVKQPLPHLLASGPTASYTIWKVKSHHLDCWLWDIVTSTSLLTSKMDVLDTLPENIPRPSPPLLHENQALHAAEEAREGDMSSAVEAGMWSLFSRLSRVPGHLIEGWNEEE